MHDGEIPVTDQHFGVAVIANGEAAYIFKFDVVFPAFTGLELVDEIFLTALGRVGQLQVGIVAAGAEEGVAPGAYVLVSIVDNKGAMDNRIRAGVRMLAYPKAEAAVGARQKGVAPVVVFAGETDIQDFRGIGNRNVQAAVGRAVIGCKVAEIRPVGQQHGDIGRRGGHLTRTLGMQDALWQDQQANQQGGNRNGAMEMLVTAGGAGHPHGKIIFGIHISFSVN